MSQKYLDDLKAELVAEELKKHHADKAKVQLLRDQIEVEELERRSKSGGVFTREDTQRVFELNDRIHAAIVTRQLSNRDN